LTHDLKLGQSFRAHFGVLLESNLGKHDGGTVHSETSGRMVLPENLATYPSRKPANLSLIHVSQCMQILVQEGIVNIRLQMPSVSGQMCNLLQQYPVHHDEIRAHLVKRPNILWKVCQAQ